MIVKDGYRFIQGLIPAKMHKDLTKISRDLGQSRAETLRNAIEAFLKTPKGKSSEGCKDGQCKNDRV